MDTIKILLNCAPIRRNGVAGVDTTVKSAKGFWKRVAPTWSMVMDHKKTGNDQAYIALYASILNQGGIELARQIYREGKRSGGSLTFLCYCANGKFCHTHLLIDWLVKNYPEGFQDGR